MPSTISVECATQVSPLAQFLGIVRIKRTVDVTETTSLTLLCVMQTASPIHGNVTLASIEARGTFHAPTSAYAAELKQAIEHRTIVSDIVFALLFRVRVHVVWGDPLEKVDVLVGVKLRHL